MDRLLTRAGIVLVALLSMAAAPKEGPGAKSDSDFWMDIAQPGRKQYQAALRRGRALYDTVMRLPTLAARKRALEDALAEFRQATRHGPNMAEGHYWVGKAVYLLESIETSRAVRTRYLKETVAAFSAVRRLQPDFADEFNICFKLGIAYSKLGRFEDAVQEYNRADRLLGNDYSKTGSRSTMHSNAAESLMTMGRLDEAIQRYQESVALQAGNVLGWWGLAVAYDRDEQVSKAKEAVNRALAVDPTMSKLTDDGVFFMPEGDIHYYFALGYQIKGDDVRAKTEWQSFIAKLPKSQWVVRARAHLVELGAAPAAQKSKTRLAPFPKAQGAEPESIAQEQANARYRIQSALYRIRQCYQTELRKHATLAGQLRLNITIGKDGRAQDVKVASSTLKRPSLATCVSGIIKTIYFNRPTTGSLKLSYPMEFKPVIQ